MAQHPAVHHFIEKNDDLRAVLQGLPEPRAPIAQALLVLLDAWTTEDRNVDAALEEAKKVPLENADPDLLIVFLSYWAYVLLRRRRGAEAEVLINRAKTLFTENTPPEIRAHVMQTEGNLAGLVGNTQRRVEIYDEAIALLAPGSLHRPFHVWSRALFFARMGRGKEIEEDLRWLRSRVTRWSPGTLDAVRFIDDVFTGRFGEAEKLLTEIESQPPVVAEMGRAFRNPRLLLGLVRGDSKDPEVARALDQDGTVPAWHHVTRFLLDRRAAEALGWARQWAGRGLLGSAEADFISYSLIRAELSSGNGEAARRLLELRAARGARHYLDDFFFARIALLAGDKEEAARRFALAQRSFERYDAEGLLDLELRMACEVAPRDLLWLGRAADRAPAKAAAAADPLPPPAPAHGADALLGVSPAIVRIRDEIHRYAPLDAAVLITGETGTGKDLVARALHDERLRAGDGRPPAADRRSPSGGPSPPRPPDPSLPFVAVNCGAIAETLLETELFGHERGAFTGADRAHRGLFEEAGSGTLFLDEIGDIPPRLQLALLRVLETGEVRPVGSARSRRVSCRIIAATNAELKERVEAGLFRQDLLFRLNRLEIRIPPLRERPQDILPLAGHFLDLGRRPGTRAEMTAPLKAALLRHPWPGNARELRNEIERMRLLNSDRLQYDVRDLRGGLGGEEGEPPPRAAAPPPPGAPGGPRRDLRPRAGAEAPVFDAEVEGLLRANAVMRRDRVLDLFRKHPKLTRAVIARVLGVSLNTATSDLKALVREGLVEKVRPTPSPRSHYFVIQKPTA